MCQQADFETFLLQHDVAKYTFINVDYQPDKCVVFVFSGEYNRASRVRCESHRDWGIIEFFIPAFS
jgi:hypothetical protein